MLLIVILGWYSVPTSPPIHPVDIPPGVFQAEERVIEKFIIYNDGTGSSEFGNYVVEYEGEEIGTVKSHKRSEGALELIRKALNNYLL